MKRKLVSMAVLGLALLGTSAPVLAREIGEFSNFTVKYSGSEKYTSYVLKEATGRNGVVNLSNDTGTAWITANMRNADGAYRGVLKYNEENVPNL